MTVGLEVCDSFEQPSVVVDALQFMPRLQIEFAVAALADFLRDVQVPKIAGQSLVREVVEDRDPGPHKRGKRKYLPVVVQRTAVGASVMDFLAVTERNRNLKLIPGKESS